MARYWVSCRAALSGGAITHLRDAGIYLSAESLEVTAGSASGTRHYLSVEARDSEDALLIARGALAIAGAVVDDLNSATPRRSARCRPDEGFFQAGSTDSVLGSEPWV